MATRVLVIWTLVLLTGWAAAFGFFNKYFDGADLERKKVASLQKQIRKQERTVAKLESRFSEYKDALAVAGIKIDPKTTWLDSKRSLASVISNPGVKSTQLWPRGQISLNFAKKVFLTENYRRAAELFEEFISRYPDHPELAQAQYLLSESYFQMGNTESFLRSVNSLITHFPETEPACIGLVRLGKIFERQERLEDAQDVYKMALPLYPKSKCAELAQANLKGLKL